MMALGNFFAGKFFVEKITIIPFKTSLYEIFSSLSVESKILLRAISGLKKSSENFRELQMNFFRR
jgi:hypothetical protein